MEEALTVANGLYLQGRICESAVNFLVDTGSGVSIVASRIWRCRREGLTKYWGRLCLVEGRAFDCLGRGRLAVNLGSQVITWDFLMAEIGEDEGILGNACHSSIAEVRAIMEEAFAVRAVGRSTLAPLHGEPSERNCLCHECIGDSVSRSDNFLLGCAAGTSTFKMTGFLRNDLLGIFKAEGVQPL